MKDRGHVKGGRLTMDCFDGVRLNRRLMMCILTHIVMCDYGRSAGYYWLNFKGLSRA